MKGADSQDTVVAGIYPPPAVKQPSPRETAALDLWVSLMKEGGSDHRPTENVVAVRFSKVSNLPSKPAACAGFGCLDTWANTWRLGIYSVALADAQEHLELRLVLRPRPRPHPARLIRYPP